MRKSGKINKSHKNISLDPDLVEWARDNHFVISTYCNEKIRDEMERVEKQKIIDSEKPKISSIA